MNFHYVLDEFRLCANYISHSTLALYGYGQDGALRLLRVVVLSTQYERKDAAPSSKINSATFAPGSSAGGLIAVGASGADGDGVRLLLRPLGSYSTLVQTKHAAHTKAIESVAFAPTAALPPSDSAPGAATPPSRVLLILLVPGSRVLMALVLLATTSPTHAGRLASTVDRRYLQHTHSAAI